MAAGWWAVSEYTPRTHEIRAAAVNHRAPLIHRQMLGQTIRDAELVALAEFDRWLVEVERAAAEKAYERGRLDERHDCDRYGEYERGEITGPQLRDNLRHPYPYRRNEGGAR